MTALDSSLKEREPEMEQLSDNLCHNFLQILKEELVPAMGCTEPIAIAFCAAKAREFLGVYPDHVLIEASGNIIKNVKSVIVPNTNGLKGLAAAAAAGIVAGKSDAQLEVISDVTKEDKVRIADFLATAAISIKPLLSANKLDIRITLTSGTDYSTVRVSGHHTNISFIEYNGKVLFDHPYTETTDNSVDVVSDHSTLSIENIFLFANNVSISDIRPILDPQIEYNTAISEEGLRHDWGASIGRTILDSCGTSVREKAKAYAAAGSDARMSGCSLPVVINCGSGNQGLAVSMPVIVYANELHSSKDRLYRALALSNLIAIHLKSGIGPLSAYCGAVSAGCAAGCGICYLKNGNLEEISHTLVNSIVITSGIVCDGAKPSCAAKIATSVDAGIFGYEMFAHGNQFYDGEGLVVKGVENTIKNISRLGAEGMNDTDRKIIQIMTNC